MVNFHLRKKRKVSPGEGELVEEAPMKGRPPIFLRQRTSTSFIAFCVGLGILTDLACYGLIVPVIPFRLQALNYSSIGSRTGWLVAAYSGGLILSSPPVAWLGEVWTGRRSLLLFMLLFMMGALVLFMETDSYLAMVFSRIMQGISGTGMWTLGLALVTDSVCEERVGVVMGYVMIGFSCGAAIGPPVGGSLYEKLGYRAPFVFGLILCFFDMLLRLLIVEKHVALKWIKAGVHIPNFESPDFVPPTVKDAEDGPVQQTIAMAAPLAIAESEPSPTVAHPIPEAKKGNVWPALVDMVTTARPVTLFLMTLINGLILGGLLDTGMTLRLQQRYGLNSLGAGLVFLGYVIPSFVASPLSGWICDKYGAKGIATTGLAMAVPSILLLIVKGPLPLFIFFLVIVGISQAFLLTPIMVDLSVVVQNIEGLGSAHVYGCFNMCFSIGSFIGPIVSGQIINAVGINKGWIIMCCLSAALSGACVPLCYFYVGGYPTMVWSWKGVRKGAGMEGQEAVVVS